MTIVFGRLVSSFSSSSDASAFDPGAFQRGVNQNALYLVYLFIGKFITGYIAMVCLSLFSCFLQKYVLLCSINNVKS